uniref:Glutaredoxin-dependent peroxiredoxin n=1 Tax=Chenopodium quinoa TaxID=63459 RepID=A0A803LHR1_CHEQI
MLTTGVAPLSSPRLSMAPILKPPPMLASSRASFLSPLLGLRFPKFNSIISPRIQRLSIKASRTESKGVSLGFRPPDFQVMFICNHCPFVIHLKKDIVKLSKFYMKKGLAVVAISSNSVVTYLQDGPEFMAEEAKFYSYPFPYLYDERRESEQFYGQAIELLEVHMSESQDVAHDFGAVCTPEFFLFKKEGRRPFELVYHGQFDDSRPSNNVPITGRDLSMAIDSVLSDQPVTDHQKPSSDFFLAVLDVASSGILRLVNLRFDEP